jgi:hypothetical protein
MHFFEKYFGSVGSRGAHEDYEPRQISSKLYGFRYLLARDHKTPLEKKDTSRKREREREIQPLMTCMIQLAKKKET